jgi:hypothetical protein
MKNFETGIRQEENQVRKIDSGARLEAAESGMLIIQLRRSRAHKERSMKICWSIYRQYHGKCAHIRNCRSAYPATAETKPISVAKVQDGDMTKIFYCKPTGVFLHKEESKPFRTRNHEVYYEIPRTFIQL